MLSGSVVASVITADKFESNSTRVTKVSNAMEDVEEAYGFKTNVA